jgi:negative regulator of flagellin synthesis FlgM
MKILSSNTTRIDTSPATGGVARPEERRPAASPTSSAGARDAGTVRIDPRASLLAAAESSMADAPEIDMARIAEIKQAIAEGRFEIDSRRVAERLAGSVRDLILTRSN